MKTSGSTFPYFAPVQPVDVTALAQAAFKPPAVMTLSGISTPPPPQEPGFDVKGALDALRGIMNMGSTKGATQEITPTSSATALAAVAGMPDWWSLPGFNTGEPGIPNLALEYDPLTNSLRPRRGQPGPT